MSYSVIIVDDELQHSDYLNRLLRSHFQNFKVISTCTTVSSAIAEINALKPDLVFMDIMLHPGTGFDVLEKINHDSLGVIFTTSHESYSLRAIKLSAIDYLLKPYGIEDLSGAIDRFLKTYEAKLSSKNLKQLIENIQSPKSSSEKVALPVANGYRFIQINEIVRIETAGSYTVVYTTAEGPTNQIVTNKSIKECEDLLDDERFFIPHRSHLINLNYIKAYEKGDGGTITMDDGSIIELSRRKKDEFFDRMKKL